MEDFLPYFAGYIDGDGHFRFKKYIQDGYECFTCKIMITSTCEEPLKLFKEKIGGTYYAKSKTQQKWKQEYIYTFHISQKSFEKIKTLRNFLIEKRNQFELIESFIFGDKSQKLEIVERAKVLRESEKCDEISFQRCKSFYKEILPTSQDFIYLAGFIDAECCLTVTRKILKHTNSVSFSCHLRCASTKFPCIEFLIRRWGGCIYFKKSKNENWSDCIQWQLTDKSLEKILNDIEPFLINKKEQCFHIRKLRETYISKPFPRDPSFHSYYTHFTPIRESIYLTLKHLNKRGL